MALIWPPSLRPQGIDVFLKPMTVRGPSTPSGQQTVGSDAGYWTMSITSVPLATEHQIREWRYIIAALQGGLETVGIGPFDAQYAPLLEGVGPFIDGVTHSDGALHSDGSGYAQSTIVTRFYGGHASGATTATVEILRSAPLFRGMYFSVLDPNGDERLYIVTSAPQSIEVPPGSFARVSFNFLPPLRGASLSAANVEFGDPKGTWRLASAETGRLALTGSIYGDPSAEFVEAYSGIS